jgi:hypothetical protein
MKIYRGNLFAFGEQLEVVIASKNKSQVAKRIGETYYTINGWWNETGNDDDIKLALSNPNNPMVQECISRNEHGHTLQEFQEYINKYCKPKTYIRPYIRRMIKGDNNGKES